MQTKHLADGTGTADAGPRCPSALGDPDPWATGPGGPCLPPGDLYCLAGTLEEVATIWRRAHCQLPGLPLLLPVQLADAARQLAADVPAFAVAGLDQSPDLALALARQLADLREGIAAARAMTCDPGLPPVGDAALWEGAHAAVQRAETRLLSVILHMVKIRDWSLTGAPGASPPCSGQLRLLVELG